MFIYYYFLTNGQRNIDWRKSTDPQWDNDFSGYVIMCLPILRVKGFFNVKRKMTFPHCKPTSNWHCEYPMAFDITGMVRVFCVCSGCCVLWLVFSVVSSVEKALCRLKLNSHKMWDFLMTCFQSVFTTALAL